MKTIIRTAILPLALALSACAPPTPAEPPAAELTIEIVEHREIAPGHAESGYSLDYTVGRVSPDALSAELLALEPEIAQAVADYELHMSHIPNIAYRRFSDAEAVLNFIGYAPLRAPDIGMPMQALDPALHLKPATVSVHGHNDGRIHTVGYELWYADDRFHVQTFATLHTTAYDFETGTGSWTRDNYVYTTTERPCADGTKALIVESAPANGNVADYRTVGAYRIRDDVFYRIHIPYSFGFAQEAREVVERWLAGLE